MPAPQCALDSVRFGSKLSFHCIAVKNNCVRKVDAVTKFITTVAGVCGAPNDFSPDGTLATTASLKLLGGVAVDSAGNLFISEEGNACVRKVDHSTGLLSTVAGDCTHQAPGFVSANGQPGKGTALNDPAVIALDPAGNLFIPDYASSNNEIEVVYQVASGSG